MIELRGGVSRVFNVRVSVEKVIVLPITIIEGEAKGRAIGN